MVVQFGEAEEETAFPNSRKILKAFPEGPQRGSADSAACREGGLDPSQEETPKSSRNGVECVAAVEEERGLREHG